MADYKVKRDVRVDLIDLSPRDLDILSRAVGSYTAQDEGDINNLWDLHTLLKSAIEECLY